MSRQMADNHGSAGASVRTVVIDLVVAVLVFTLGAIVGFDSYRLGASWGSDGPQAGYFPFYIGSDLCLRHGGVRAKLCAARD
jgi:hypothetical protein